MKVKTGKEPYQQDPESLIKTIKGDWWKELDEAIQKEIVVISHTCNFLLALILKGADWLVRTTLLAGSHYFLIKRNREAILADKPQWAFYQDIASSHDAGRIFKAPETISPPKKEKVLKENFHDGRIVRLQFDSKFKAINPYFKDSYWQHHNNRNIDCELWQHEGKARPTLIFMHGYDADAFEINRTIFSAKKLYLDGNNICFLLLPFHSGKLLPTRQVWHFFGNGPAYTSEVFAHAVYDCRSLISYFLENNIASKVGVGGISLGGFVSSLVISSDSRVDCAVLLSPVYNLPESFMEWFPLKGLFTEMLKEENISFEEFRHAYATCNALTFSPQIDTKKIVILTGILDLIALPKYVKLLGEHWQQCDIHWLNYAHVGITKTNPFYKEISDHIKTTGF